MIQIGFFLIALGNGKDLLKGPIPDYSSVCVVMITIMARDLLRIIGSSIYVAITIITMDMAKGMLKRTTVAIPDSSLHVAITMAKEMLRLAFREAPPPAPEGPPPAPEALQAPQEHQNFSSISAQIHQTV